MGRLPSSERVKTRLSRGLRSGAAAELYRAFLLDTFSQVEAATLEMERWFVCALEEGEELEAARTLLPAGWHLAAQVGEGLGPRMQHAGDVTRADRVVVVGSDSPTMSPHRIVRAFEQLEDPAVSVVLGPTADGGYNLIAFKGALPPSLWAMPWSTSAVMEATLAAAAAEGLRVGVVEEGYDIDELQDLQRALEDASKPGSLARETLRAIRLVLQEAADRT